MRIAYRRMSGPIGVTKWESGTRGLWLEKRLALVKALRARGHRVDYVNRMTKFSQQGSPIRYDSKSHELLIVEFGSSNRAFYGEDLTETERLVAEHPGRIIFICDDPDLPYTWKTVPAGKLGQFRCWYNAAYPVAFGSQPEGVEMRSFPVAGLMEAKAPALSYEDHLVYLGRPKGREKVFHALFQERVPLKIYGREDEWKEFGVKVYLAPAQAQRADFYARQMGSLVIADSKHKRMGWYTGRAFHAILAGCPAIAEADHPGLQGIQHFRALDELKRIVESWRCAQTRLLDWNVQRDWVKTHRIQCERVFSEENL